MKKTLALLLMLLLCAGLVLTACGGGASSAAPASTAPASAAPAAAEPEEEDVVDEEEDVVDEEEDVDAGEDDVNAQIIAEADAMASLFDAAYYGLSTDGDEVVMLMGPDAAALAFVNGDVSASFVGEYTTDDTAMAMTIVDENNGLQITFVVEEDGDGYWLDIGDVGDVYVEPMDLEDGILAMLGISYGTVAVA